MRVSKFQIDPREEPLFAAGPFFGHISTCLQTPSFSAAMDASEPSLNALTYSELPDLKLLSRGKVRDIYETSSPDHLLFVASDRISAYDVILRNVSCPTTL